MTKTAKPEIQRRDLTVREFRMAPQTIDEAQFSVESTMATEAPVLVFDMREWEMIQEILSMDGLQPVDQVPFLDNHKRMSNDDVYGSTRNIRVESGELVGRSFFDSDDTRAMRAWNKVKKGHIRDVSVGYQVLAFQDLKPGEERQIGSKTYKNESQRRLRVVTSWRLVELSLTPIGADSGAKMRKEPEMAGSEKEEERAATQPTGSKVVQKVEDETARELRATRQRLMAVCPTGMESVAERLILEGKGFDEARAALLEEFSKRAAPVGSEEPAPVARASRVEPQKAEAPIPTNEEFKRGLAATLLS